VIRLWGRNTFSALRVTPFRWLLAGRLVTFMAWQIGLLAQNWLVYALTGSALTLGWVRAGWSVSSIAFSPVGGVVADRMEKKRLIVLGQAGLGIMPLVIAALAFLGHISIWMLALNYMTLGLFFSFIMPARESYTTELMGRRAMLNAIALNTMGMAFMGIISSTAGGAIVERLGAAVAFLIAGLLYIGTVLLFLPLPRSSVPHQRVALSVRSEFRAGLRYAVSQPAILSILGLELVRVLFLLPYQTLLPVFAADVFRQGAFGLGMMTATSSLGEFLGSLLVASLGDYRRKGLLLLASGSASALMLLLFAHMSYFHLALAFLLLLSMANNAYMVTRSALLQTTASPEMRGRMVGFWRLIWGLSPLGTLPAGALTDHWGAPLTVSLQALVSLLVFGGLLVSASKLRHLE